MKAVSEFKYSVQNPTGEELLIVNKREGLGYKSYKVKLSDIKDWMSQPVQGEKYIVELDPNGGMIDGYSNIKTLQLTPGAEHANLPTPTARQAAANHAGVQFDGWWTDAWEGYQVAQDVKVPDDPGKIKLYAHWKGVIHYGTVGTVSFDINGVATLSRKTDNGVERGAILTTDHDLFDFSKDFRVVMKCQRGSDDGWWHETRQDVFAGFANHRMDFGIVGYGYPQWEIANPIDGGVTLSENPIFTSSNNGEIFWLGVDVDCSRTNKVWCYCIPHGENDWRLDYTGPGLDFVSDRFYLGGDADATNTGYQSQEYEPFYGKIFLKECYLLQKSTNAGNPKGKYILEPEV